MKKTVPIFSVMLLISIAMIASDSSIPDWYKVEKWEIEVCSKWGGTADAQTHGGSAKGSAYMFSTTVTLQGQKTIIEEDGKNTTIYEAAWYFRPMDKQQEYSIMFIGDETKTIYTGSARPEFGDSNYHAEESDKDYTSVSIKYETGTLTVPIVEK